MTRNSAQDTLFIDMKYIILYRKLGFEEKSKDIFVKKYNYTTLKIESENQRFFFKDNWYKLFTYKDMVRLELIDRLLQKGYSPNQIELNTVYDVTIMDQEKIYIGVYCEDWGKDYRNRIDRYEPNLEILESVYASRLTGGLIEFDYKIYSSRGVFDFGIFENDAPLFNNDFSVIEDDFDFDNNDFEIRHKTLVKYIGADKHVKVPVGISKIGTGAFWNNLKVETIELPDTLKCIAGDAFVYCENLENLTIPKSVEEIGDDPFAGCLKLNLECVSPNFHLVDGVLFSFDRKVLIHYSALNTETLYEIPETVTWLGKHSFYKCNNLQKIIITKNINFVGNNVFSDCENIVIENQSPFFTYINGLLCNSQLTDIYHYSLGSKNHNVIIPEGIRTIGRNTFWNARNVKSITIPSSVRQIGYNPFAYCLNAKIINHSPYYDIFNGLLYSNDLTELICCTSRMAEKEVNLSNKLISIGRNAFTGCESLSSISLPAELKYINRGAFSGCVNLKEITIPLSVVNIGDWVFNNCTSLDTIWLPYDLKLEINALANCPAKVIRY